MARMDISKETGTTPDSIAQYLLRQQNFDNVSKQYRVKLENWITNENGQNKYDMGMSITVPDEKEIIKITLVRLPHIRASDDRTLVPNPQPNGWTLTKEGKLFKGKTGYFIDENSLYINKDGTRTATAQGSNTEGDPDIKQGLIKIIGTDIDWDGCTTSFNAYNDLFMRYGENMNTVVYQAFQINKGYQINKGTWVNTPYDNSKFSVLGKDETGIPIVVTRVGQEQALNKLITAGAHGDERCAHRLIMISQRELESDKTILPATESIYFIPSLSPTMAFADVRGIPNTLIEPTTGLLKSGQGISGLYHSVYSDMRIKIKEQKNPMNPEYGIDANRDARKILVSTNKFLDFLKTKNNPSGNTAVIFVHGYDATWGKSDEGTVYPQYYISNEKAEVLPGRDAISKEVRRILGWTHPQDQGYLYSDTPTNPAKYNGEFTRSLAQMHIPAMDIELPAITFDEGIRQDSSHTGYDNIEKTALQDFSKTYSSLLKQYWSIPDIKTPNWQGW